jgi:hypothetical protein
LILSDEAKAMRRTFYPRAARPSLSPDDGLHEVAVDSRITGELGMERRCEQVALPRGHNLPVMASEHLHAFANVLDPRSADEDAAIGFSES